jgi:outer membrane protein assembly factor BamB
MKRQLSKIQKFALLLWLFGICWIMLFLWGTVRGQQLLTLSLYPKSEPKPPNVNYQVTSLSDRYEQLWVLPLTLESYRYGIGGIHLIGAENNIMILGSLDRDKYGTLSLVNMDPLTGDVNWELFEPSKFREGPASTIAVNSEFIYVGFEGTGKIDGETEWGAAKIIAYDINTGDFVWSKIIGGARNIDSLVVSDTTVSVDGSFSSHYYMYDAKIGALLSKRNKAKENFVWFIHDGIQYEHKSGEATFQAVDTDTGTINWQSGANYAVSQPPMISHNVIVARAGEAKFLGLAFGVDATTGRTLWEYQKIIGNVAVDGNVAYFLTQEVQLWAVDIRTGDRLGVVRFSPDAYPDSVNNPYHVAASNGIVVVYLGEGQQMFAFRFSPENPDG